MPNTGRRYGSPRMGWVLRKAKKMTPIGLWQTRQVSRVYPYLDFRSVLNLWNISYSVKYIKLTSIRFME